MLINSKQTIGWLTKKKSDLPGPDVLLLLIHMPSGYACIRVEEKVALMDDLRKVWWAIEKGDLVADDLGLIDTQQPRKEGVIGLGPLKEIAGHRVNGELSQYSRISKVLEEGALPMVEGVAQILEVQAEFPRERNSSASSRLSVIP